MRQGVETRVAAVVCAIIVGLVCTSCRSLYYGTMEAFGRQKRHILKSRVESGRKNQEKAKTEFKSAFEQFKAVAG